MDFLIMLAIIINFGLVLVVVAIAIKTTIHVTDLDFDKHNWWGVPFLIFVYISGLFFIIYVLIRIAYLLDSLFI